MFFISNLKEYPNINIQNTIQLAEMLVNNFIRIPLRIPENIPRNILLKKARSDLENNLRFKIDFPDMPYFDNKNIPAILKVDGGDRRNGGSIRIKMNMAIIICL